MVTTAVYVSSQGKYQNKNLLDFSELQIEIKRRPQMAECVQ